MCGSLNQAEHARSYHLRVRCYKIAHLIFRVSVHILSARFSTKSTASTEPRQLPLPASARNALEPTLPAAPSRLITVSPRPPERVLRTPLLPPHTTGCGLVGLDRGAPYCVLYSLVTRCRSYLVSSYRVHGRNRTVLSQSTHAHDSASKQNYKPGRLGTASGIGTAEPRQV